jgi:hypothetical protein
MREKETETAIKTDRLRENERKTDGQTRQRERNLIEKLEVDAELFTQCDPRIISLRNARLHGRRLSRHNGERDLLLDNNVVVRRLVGECRENDFVLSKVGERERAKPFFCC